MFSTIKWYIKDGISLAVLKSLGQLDNGFSNGDWFVIWRENLFGVVDATLILILFLLPFLRMKAEGKACRGEGSAKEKVTSRRATSEVCCAACTVGNGCALKMKNTWLIVTEQPHPLSCFENCLLFSNPANVTRTPLSWTLKAAALSFLE